MHRLVTDRKLGVIDDETGKSHAHVWAVGDASVIEDEPLPATAQVASQKALVCALTCPVFPVYILNATLVVILIVPCQGSE